MRCTTFGSAMGRPCGGIGPVVTRRWPRGPEAVSWGQAASESPLGLGAWAAFSEAEVSKLIKPACCLTASCNERSSAACFWAAASRNDLVASMCSFNLASGALILSITLSMTPSTIVAAVLLLVWACIRNTTAQITVQASAGSLNKSVAARSMSESFAPKLSSELSIQPLFSSQDRASFAEETGLGEAVICASRSAQGEKSRALCGDVVFWLLLVPCESAQDPVFCLEESLILSGGQEWGVVRTSEQREWIVGARGFLLFGLAGLVPTDQTHIRAGQKSQTSVCHQPTLFHLAVRFLVFFSIKSSTKYNCFVPK